MRKWKFAVFSLVAVFGLLVMPVTTASAFNPFGKSCQAGGAQSAVCTNSSTGDPLTGPNGLIGKITRLVALFAGVSAVIIMIIAGLMYVTSAGDSGKVSRAKDTMIYAAVGLVVIVLGQAIIIFVIDRL